MNGRIIKFRAWDGKEMHLPEYSDKEDFHLLPDGTVVHTYEVGYERHEQTQRRDDKWLVMQYAGLEDKNGKEIYEGDIVKFHYFYGSGGLEGFVEAEHELTGVVEWGAFGWGICAIKGEHWNGYTGYNDGEGSSNFLDLMAMNESSINEESFEIIGNIYQNQDLLK